MLDDRETRIKLVFNEKGMYAVETFFHCLHESNSLQDAATVFEVLEMVEEPPGSSLRALKKAIKTELHSVRNRSSKRNHAYIVKLVDCVEKRLAGMRPKMAGRNWACVEWVANNA